MTPAEVEDALRQFEGLVTETARQVAQSGVEREFDDIRQVIRVKVWHAVLKFDADRAAGSKHLSRSRDRYGRTPLQRYVFLCVTNLRKDFVKAPRRFNLSLDELREDDGRHGVEFVGTARPDQFDARYLSTDADQVHDLIEENGDLLAELTEIERRVVMLRLEGRLLCEIDRELGLSRAQRERLLRSVREKLAHLNPEPEPRSAPMLPLPGAAPPPKPAREPLAA